MRTALFVLASLVPWAAPARAQTVVFHEDFESGLGAWNATGLWNWELDSDPCGAPLAPFPTGSGAAYLGNDGVCNIDLPGHSGTGTLGTLSLANPIVLPAGATRATLRFRYAISMEPYDPDNLTCWDEAGVGVAVPGVSWTACSALDGIGPPGPGWHDGEVDLTVAIGQPVRPTFGFWVYDDLLGEAYFGWLIDDVRIEVETGVASCGAPCPCDNAVGEQPWDRAIGCENSRGTGADLAGGGAASVSADSLSLTARGMPPTTSALLVQGTLEQTTPFGDGLLCLGGAIRRLLVRTASGGVASFPGTVPHGVASLGGVPAGGGTRVYQVFYRDQSAAHCTPGRFNLSNAYTIVWTP